MSLTLHVDGARWRAHLDAVATANPGLTPVVKGNGYGLTLPRLARRAGWLRDQGHDLDTIAVGTYSELETVASRFDGDLLVLTPWRPFGPELELDVALERRVVHTVGRLEDLVALLDLLVVAEDDDADGVLFKVERQPLDVGAGEVEHLARHGRGQAVDAGDAVAHLQHPADLARVEARFGPADFTLEY